MTWLRTRSRSHDHPVVLDVIGHEHADQRSINEVFGFIARWANAEAMYQDEDEIVLTYPRAISLAGWAANADRLIELAEYSGYIFEVDATPPKRGWVLANTETFGLIKSQDNGMP